ncbi:Alpha/beta hydrolase fold-3 [Penicillium bovifimosum]|uniref:Alpha/beta hydrolase fold-3 n=1 Tax=Penicillium bovifimosum TaxID=126998 RepID=A0A9W9L456_9EURO|nr:Alpha/beta hydrolase fold-3 [Penicillium bovifimosum]KAJ5135329.1 Alpha/beta hydrolase fold-3 [Penicillium bovifimosum]
MHLEMAGMTIYTVRAVVSPSGARVGGDPGPVADMTAKSIGTDAEGLRFYLSVQAKRHCQAVKLATALNVADTINVAVQVFRARASKDTCRCAYGLVVRLVSCNINYLSWINGSEHMFRRTKGGEP